MSKKDFEAIAAILKAERTLAIGLGEAPTQVSGVALELADHFMTVNPRFDRIRFLTAAGL